MRKVIVLALFAASQAVWAQRADEYSLQLTEYLMSVKSPSAPVLFEGQVVFTAPSTYRRAGVAFAHEGFALIHWFRKLELPIEDVPSLAEAGKTPRRFYGDSGVLFTVYSPPSDAASLEYRLITDGLWQPDPLNKDYRFDSVSGVKNSIVYLPKPAPRVGALVDTDDGRVRFYYDGEESESVYLTGSFNNWDPFMYELREFEPGRYTIALGFSPGVYHYAFFHRGERVRDSANPSKAYLADGSLVSVLEVK